LREGIEYCSWDNAGSLVDILISPFEVVEGSVAYICAVAFHLTVRRGDVYDPIMAGERSPEFRESILGWLFDHGLNYIR